MSGLVNVLVPYFIGMLSIIILLNVYQHPIIKKGWWMFAIPIATFLLSYVMVPMFHVMGHGMMHGGSTESTSASMSHHNVRLDVLVEPYRNIPIKVTTVPRFIQFDDTRLQMIKINVQNTSAKEVKVRIRDKIEPGALSNFLDYDLPGQEMKLGPKEKQQWLVQVNLADKVPNNINDASLSLFLFDTKDVGQLGKKDSWKKMHVDFVKQLENQHEK